MELPPDIVLVDGSNVRRSGWPNRSPEWLVARLDAWARQGAVGADEHVVVVFDGRSGAESTSRVEVVDAPYADDELVEIAAEAIDAGGSVRAATSDRELRARLEATGASVAWGGGRFLRAMGDDGLEPPTPSV